MMATFLLVGRMLLAAVFAVAGVAKLADRQGSRQAVTDFGLPPSLAAPLGLLLPLAELVVAASLVPASTAWWGAMGALGLLLVFVAGIAINLARGRKPDCHCFGQLHSAPAGWKTLARNGALAAVAGFVLWRGYDGTGPSAVAWLGDLSTAQLAGLIGGLVVLGLLAGQWWFLVHVLRQNGRLLVRVEALEMTLAAEDDTALSPTGSAATAQASAGLPVGSRAPGFNLSGIYGETLTLDSLRASDKPVVLLFTDPNCGPCTALLPEIGRWQEEYSDKLTVALISRGTIEENRARSTEHGLTQVLLQTDWEISDAYQVRGTPSAVLVRPDGTLGSRVAAGSAAIRDLVRRAVEAPTQVPLLPEAPAPTPTQGQPCPKCGKAHPNGTGLQQAMPAAREIGEPAPKIELKDLAGKEVDLSNSGGSETLVLLWNPGCGFCQQMLPELKKWEADSPAEGPRLLLVSAGTEEANREMGLSSTVVLDQEFAVGRAFGASGTPSAVLVDNEGKVASEVAVGAPAVLELAGARKAEA